MNKQPVYYMQTDSRWGNKPYRVPGEDATVKGSGCGPSCAAMLIETITGKKFTPLDACNWAMKHGYKALNQGTYYSYFTPQFAAFGIEAHKLNAHSVYHNPKAPAHDKAMEMLQDGYYLIACMGRGNWTKGGHYVVLWWAEDYMYINDPASTKPHRTRGDRDTFFNEVKYYFWVDARFYNKIGGDIHMDEKALSKFIVNVIKKYEADRAKLPSTFGDLFEDAIQRGITDGSRPKSFATRDEVALMVRKSELKKEGD